jgi:diguanylate cyclase (GGDEF)-like protein/PAS domain S-box-containing protein
MLALSGYKYKEKIYKSSNSYIYRGSRKADGLSVVLKHLRRDCSTPGDVARFRREFETVRSLNPGDKGAAVSGVVAAYSWEQDHHSIVFVMEDFGAISLERWLEQRAAEGAPLFQGLRQEGAVEFVILAIKITAILEQIHRHRIIHKDISPANIVYNQETGQIKLIDFGASTGFSQEVPGFCSHGSLEGTLAYMSPEQTGRLNRVVDHRSDLYSLGATFYEILTGRTPFTATDPLELVHCHIARQPTPAHQLCPDLPPAIADIVMKLLSKDAEDRYQSASGLLSDLEECKRELLCKGRIDAFVPGAGDIPQEFRIPQKLYERASEINALMASFERVSRGGSEITLLSGAPGIGKTMLVKELYKPLTRQRGYFISGKFDQYTRNIPYSALLQAFRSLIKQVLTESLDAVTAWRRRLLTALGPNGAIITEVIPDLELIIGTQPQVLSLAQVEAQNRFQLTFQNFVRTFARPEHPLVIFLDDVQWSDAASLKMIHMLMTMPDCRYILLIAAYRDNEVSPSHPFIETAAALNHAGAALSSIPLESLSLSDICRMTADALRCSAERAHPLAEIVHRKTGGNPFFAAELLKALYAEGVLRLDNACGIWTWSLDQARIGGISENVVDFMLGRMRKLTTRTQQALRWAACIGSVFDLGALAIVVGRPSREIALALWPAVEEGFIAPLSDAYRFIDLESNGEEERVEYRFVHDRVQQAAYSLIPKEDRPGAHWRVGWMLLKNTPVEKRENCLFEIVNQLNQGLDLLTHISEREELVRINLDAGRKAKATAAYGPAFDYYRTGLDLLGSDSWKQDYDLALSVHVEAAEAAFLSGAFEEMDHLMEEVISHARDVLDQAKVMEVKIQALTVRGRPTEAIEAALEILGKLDVALPAGEGGFAASMQTISDLMAGRRVEELLDLPAMNDPEKSAAMRILSGIASPCHIARPDLFPLIPLKQVELSLLFGNTPASSSAYVLYGLLLCGLAGDFDTGYQFGKLAMSVLERFHALPFKAMVSQLFDVGIRHWKDPFRDMLPTLRDAHQAGVENGDFAYAAYSAHQVCIHLFFMGCELSEVQQQMETYSAAIENIRQDTARQWNQGFHQAALNLMGRSEDPVLLVGQAFDENAMLLEYRRANNRTGLCTLHLNKMILAYLFHRRQEAVRFAATAESLLDGLTGLLLVPVFYFYDSLIQLAVYPELPSDLRDAALKKVADNQCRMSKWAEHSPVNYRHKHLLVEAEWKRVLGDYDAARELYDQAVELAAGNGFVNEEALAYELAGRFYLSQNRPWLAKAYLREAHSSFLRWEAMAKVGDLDARYAEFLEAPEMDSFHGGAPASPRLAPNLDLTTVIKASHAISGEIVLHSLLEKLMQVLIENAGAERGLIVMEREGRLSIEAECSTGMNPGNGELCCVLQPGSFDKADEQLSTEIVNYVARTCETVSLGNAAESGPFTASPYIRSRDVKSVLCLPVLRGGRCAGILYLENNLTANCFTPERVELLSVLAAQAAISLENARMYAELEEMVDRRTAELAESNARFEAFMEHLPALVFIKDETSRTLYVNRCFEEQYGSDWVGTTVHDHFPEDVARTMREDDRLGLLGVRQKEEVVTALDGSTCTYHTTKFPIHRIGKPVLLGGFAIDVTERKRYENELKKLNRDLERASRMDLLTGLSNRRDMIERIQYEMVRSARSGKPFSLIMADADHFKGVNDAFGHDAGDFVLISIGRLMRENLRRQDVCSRWGGEEFLILLPETDACGAKTIANKLRLIHEGADIQFKGKSLRVTLSLGVSSFSAGLSVDDCIKQADECLYAAKRLGRNRCVCPDDLASHAPEAG